MIAAQIAAALATLLLVGRLAYNLSGRFDIALLAAVLGYLELRLGQSAGTIRPTAWFPLFLFAYLTAVTEQAGRPQPWQTAIAGAAAGMAALFEPLTAVVLPLTAAQLYRQAPTSRGGWRALIFLAASVVTSLGLWGLAVRAGLDPAGMARHLGWDLGQRAAFAGMTREAWLAGIVLPLPFIGNLLAAMLPQAWSDMLSIGTVPGSLAREGLLVIYPDAFERAGRSAIATNWLIVQERFLAHPLDYAVSSLAVAARGILGGGSPVALIGLFHVPLMLRYAAADGRAAPHALVVLPAFAMLLVNTLLSANGPWLNPVLPVLYVYAIAYVAGGW